MPQLASRTRRYHAPPHYTAYGSDVSTSPPHTDTDTDSICSGELSSIGSRRSAFASYAIGATPLEGSRINLSALHSTLCASPWVPDDARGCS